MQGGLSLLKKCLGPPAELTFCAYPCLAREFGPVGWYLCYLYKWNLSSHKRQTPQKGARRLRKMGKALGRISETCTHSANLFSSPSYGIAWVSARVPKRAAKGLQTNLCDSGSLGPGAIPGSAARSTLHACKTRETTCQLVGAFKE